MLCFSVYFSAMFLSDGTVISISLQVEFTESLMTMSGLFAAIVLSVLTGMSHMKVILLSLLCITVSGSCWYHLSVSLYHDPYRCSSRDMGQHYCAWRCTLF